MKHRLKISTEKASKQTSDHALPLGVWNRESKTGGAKQTSEQHFAMLYV